MEGIGHDISVWLVNLIADHPTLIGWIVAVFIFATFVVNAIKWTWPVYHEMPKAARFALGFFMPLALNFWQLTKKVGMQEPAPPVDTPAPAKDGATT